MLMYINAIHLHIYFSNTSMSKIISVHNSARAREHYSTFVVVISSSERRARLRFRVWQRTSCMHSRAALSLSVIVYSHVNHARRGILLPNTTHPFRAPSYSATLPLSGDVSSARAHTAQAPHIRYLLILVAKHSTHTVFNLTHRRRRHTTTKSPTRNRTQSP